jgi:hypothetical protein
MEGVGFWECREAPCVQAGFSKPAKSVLATGEFDASLYANEWVAQAQFDLVADIVKQNAARMRQAIMPSIRNGEAVVSGVIHEPVTRKIIAIV